MQKFEWTHCIKFFKGGRQIEINSPQSYYYKKDVEKSVRQQIKFIIASYGIDRSQISVEYYKV